MVEALIRTLDPTWRAWPELAVPRARGYIDLAIELRPRRSAIACEAHSELRSLDIVLRRLHEKALALAELGTFGREVSTLLLVRSTERTRDVARLHAATLAAAFPARSADAIAALRGTAAWPGPAIILVRLEGGRAEILDRPPRGIRLGR